MRMKECILCGGYGKTQISIDNWASCHRCNGTGIQPLLKLVMKDPRIQGVIPESRLPADKDEVKNMPKTILFITAVLQVTFVAMNVLFISAHKVLPMLTTGFMISLIWTLNVKKVAFGTWGDRFIYATGAMVGTGIGFWISTTILKYL